MPTVNHLFRQCQGMADKISARSILDLSSKHVFGSIWPIRTKPFQGVAGIVAGFSHGRPWPTRDRLVRCDNQWHGIANGVDALEVLYIL
jgi:hypothetical protein